MLAATTLNDVLLQLVTTLGAVAAAAIPAYFAYRIAIRAKLDDIGEKVDGTLTAQVETNAALTKQLNAAGLVPGDDPLNPPRRGEGNERSPRPPSTPA